MRKFVITSQVIFLAAFLFFYFFLNRHSIAYSVDSDLFLKLNPLSTLLVSVASRHFFPNLILLSGVVLLLSIFFGRLFCGAICPLGTLVDIVDSLFTSIRSHERRPVLYFQRFKYVLLILFMVLSVFGVLVPLFFDPILLLTRMLTTVINPSATLIVNDTYHAICSLLPDTGNHLNQTFPVKLIYFSGIGISVITLVCIFAGTFWDKRFWCQYICPSGAFFGILSSLSIYRRKVTELKCNSCARCARACPTRAIQPKNVKKTSVAECIVCGVCVTMKDDCNKFAFGNFTNNESIPADIKRRHVLGAIAGGIITLPAFKATAALQRNDHGKLIRPPASVPENEFLATCLACGSCMKACPTNTLQPCMFDDGFNRLYTPKVVPKIGGCDSECALCGYVCPTGAIRKVEPSDKPYIKIGTAIIDKSKCIAWEQNKECIVCRKACPYNAIDFPDLETTGGKFSVPVVKEDLCTGCGMCEHDCPVNDQAAIYVMRFGENRRSKGEYLTKSQRDKMNNDRKEINREPVNTAPQGNRETLRKESD